MAKKSDITKTGPLGWSDLQTLNALEQAVGTRMAPTQEELDEYFRKNNVPTVSDAAQLLEWNPQIEDYQAQDQLYLSSEGKDYWGRSFFDKDLAEGWQMNNLQDTRAENQPWYSKVLNGTAKGGVTAVTTALEGLGLLYGLGQGIYNAYNAEDGKGWSAFLNGVWDNPITRVLQAVNETAEDWLPNYYTVDEQENPWGHIFSANFLGDKLIKNFGFMVGAFYGGIPASELIGKAGISAVKKARSRLGGEMAGLAHRTSTITSKYTDDVVREANALGREVAGLSDEAAASVAAKYTDEAKGLHTRLKDAGLTEAEKAQVMRKGLEHVQSVANITRGATQTVGVIGSTLNEAAIEAINNSKDWAMLERRDAKAKHENRLEEIRRTAQSEDELEQRILEENEEYNKELQAIEWGRVRMGNADLLANIPVLMASNFYELGRLYTRGFNSTRRELGSIWNHHRLGSSIAEAGTSRTRTGAVVSALLKSNTEGAEEFLQKVASDGSGKAVSDAIDRYLNAGDNENAKLEVDNYIAGMGKALAENLGDPKAWEEYFIGAVSSLIGMPVFGAQTRDAYMKIGNVGFVGGFYGNYRDYMDKRDQEIKVADYLKNRVNDPKFKEYYTKLKAFGDYETLLSDALLAEDKRLYKDLEFETLFKDINAAKSAGHLEEFKELAGFNSDYSDVELNDIVKLTSRTIPKDAQRKADTQRRDILQAVLEATESSTKEKTDEDKENIQKIKDEIAEIEARLKEDKYENQQEGPFIDRNGQMNVTNPQGMREILERNRKRLSDAIDSYLTIRNDIDIESNGALKDEQIELLTMMRAKINDYDVRSEDMVQNIYDRLAFYYGSEDDAQEKVDDAQARYDAATDPEEKQKAKKALDNAKVEANNQKVFNEISDMLSSRERKYENSAEKEGHAKGLGIDKKPLSERRRIFSEELQNFLRHKENAMALVAMIDKVAKKENWPRFTKKRLHEDVADLIILANDKDAYNRKIREFMGDPTLINEAFKNSKDRISKQEKDNKINELALRIMKVNNIHELDTLMKDAYQIDADIATAALAKAKREGTDSLKALIEDYENAIKYRNTFLEEVMKIEEPAIMEGIFRTVHDAWEYSIEQEDDSLFNNFKNAIEESTTEMSKNPDTFETGNAMLKIIKDIKDAFKGVATHKDTKKPEPAKEDGSTGGGSTLERLRRAAEAEKEGEGKDKDREEKDSKDGLLKEVEELFKTSEDYVLPKDIRDRIAQYNRDNPGDQITKGDLLKLLESVSDSKIETSSLDDVFDDKNAEIDAVEDPDSTESVKGIEMREALNGNYKSDYITWYDIRTRTFRTEYTEGSPSQKALRALLRKVGAYDFIDHNLLGYIYDYFDKHDQDLDIHFIRTTDSEVDANDTAANAKLLLAIEWTEDVQKALKAAFKNKIDISNLGKRVTASNGKQYQLIGCATVDSEAHEQIKAAFYNKETDSGLLKGVFEETRGAIDEARKASSSTYIVSEKYSTKIHSIFTGVLEKQNDENDLEGDKVSLYTFVTSDQGSSERMASMEWTSGIPFYFAVNVNEELNTNADDDTREGSMQMPNSNWMKKKGNNGAILLYVPRPDGRLYPLRCTRRSVKDWYGLQDNSLGVTGKEYILSVLNKSKKEGADGYIGNILSHLRVLYGADNDDGVRMKAKENLHRYFTFGKKSPLHFSGNTIRVDDNTFEITDDATFEGFVQWFFERLAEKEGVKFSMPSPSQEKVDSRSIIESGVFEIGLRGFYNFNANFTILPKNENNEIVRIEAGTGEGGTILGHDTPKRWELTINGTTETYFISGDDVLDKDNKPVTDDSILEAIAFYRTVDDGTAKNYFRQWLSDKYGDDSPFAVHFAEKITDFDGISVDDNGTWVCVPKTLNPEGKTLLFRIGSAEAINLLNEFEAKKDDYINKHAREIAELIKKAKEGDNKPKNEEPDMVAELDKLGYKVGVQILLKGGEKSNRGTIVGVSQEYVDVQFGDVPGSFPIDTFVRMNDSGIIRIDREGPKEDGPLFGEPSTDYPWLGYDSPEDISDDETPSGSLAELLKVNAGKGFVKNVFALMKERVARGSSIDENILKEKLTLWLSAEDKEAKKSLKSEITLMLECK